MWVSYVSKTLPVASSVSVMRSPGWARVFPVGKSTVNVRSAALSDGNEVDFSCRTEELSKSAIVARALMVVWSSAGPAISICVDAFWLSTERNRADITRALLPATTHRYCPRDDTWDP